MMEFAPPRLSITSGWPSALSISFAIALALASVAPPGGKGTIRRIGRVGQVPVAVVPVVCASAAEPISVAHASAAARERFVTFIFILLRDSSYHASLVAAGQCYRLPLVGDLVELR